MVTRDRTSPVGYKLSVIPFENGEPIATPQNNTVATEILANADNSVCPKHCLRPVGIAFDSEGRLFVSSDATGEIYVVVKDQPSNVINATPTSSVLPAPSSTKRNAAKKVSYGLNVLLIASVLSYIGC